MLTLREYQEAMIQDITGSFINYRSVMAVMPTGSGKTLTGATFALSHPKILWVAHRRELLTQADNALVQAGHADFQCVSCFVEPPAGQFDLTVLDECFPFDTMVDTLVNNKRIKVKIGDIVERQIGSHVLSSNGGTLEYKPIMSRTLMGKKELIEITISTDGGIKSVLITENGRIYANSSYVKASELKLGMHTKCLSAWCQTYLYEGNTPHDIPKEENTRIYKTTKNETPLVSSDYTTQTKGRTDCRCTSLCLRVRLASDMEQEPLQQIYTKSSPIKRTTSTIDRPTTSDHNGHSARRWEHSTNQKSFESKINRIGTPQDTPFNQKTIRLYNLASQRIVFDLFVKGLNKTKRRIWKRNSGVWNTIPSRIIQDLETFVQTTEEDSSLISEQAGPVRRCSLVDGRWINSLYGNTLFFKERKSNNSKLVKTKMGNNWDHKYGQASEQTIYRISSTECNQDVKIGIPTCSQESVVQIREVSSTTLGTIIDIKKTGKFVETYDIGVADNHNFFANDVLVHNCHHWSAPVLKRFRKTVDAKRTLGLTATPFRLDKKFLDFEDTVFGATYEELVRAGFLMPIELHSLRITGNKHVALIDWLMAHPDKAAHSIVFVPNLADARFFQTVLDLTYKVKTISGEQLPSERADALGKFMNGEVDILISCMVLTEGTDLPITQTIVLGRETESLGLLTQMIGRGLRTHINKTHCNVVEVVSVTGKSKQSVKAIVSPQKQYLVTRTSGMWNTMHLT